MAHPEAIGTAMTDDPHIAVIGPLALACLRGECPPEVLRDAAGDLGWVVPGRLIDREIGRYWPADVPRHRRALHAARLISTLLASLYDPDARAADTLVWACEPIVRHWRECQATAALRDAPPDGAGTCYHETPRPG
jgi:hypothetical protein